MWIYLRDAALSVVAHFTNPDVVLVRSRFDGDIQAVFPSVDVEYTPTFDYPYRALVDRHFFAETIASEAANIDYTNFKNSVSGHDRHETYWSVYQATLRSQRRRPIAEQYAFDLDTPF